MNNWENTLNQFRALGGVADNIVLSEGIYGRGLFPVDLKLPINIVVPNDLLLPIDWLQIDGDSNLILTEACDWSEEKKAFYLNYLQEFGLTYDLKQEIINQQMEFYNLPESLKSMLKGFGMKESLFHKPDAYSCLDAYKNSRRIQIDNKYVMMPLLELANHNEKSKTTFICDSKISLSGKFTSEILVNYQIAADAVLMHQTYGFSTQKPYAFSGAIVINLGSKVIKIARYINIYDKTNNTNLPKVSVQGNEINLSFLTIASLNDRSSPRKIFLKLMNSIGMPARIAEDTFNGIVENNRQFFKKLLIELEPLEGEVIGGLRIMAQNQLMAFGGR